VGCRHKNQLPFVFSHKKGSAGGRGRRLRTTAATINIPSDWLAKCKLTEMKDQKVFAGPRGKKSQWKVKEAKKARPKRSWPEKTLFAHGKKWYNKY